MQDEIPWEAKDVIEVIKKMNLRPGHTLPVKNIWQQIGRGKVVADGTKWLVERHHVKLLQDDTVIELTETGYDFIWA